MNKPPSQSEKFPVTFKFTNIWDNNAEEGNEIQGIKEKLLQLWKTHVTITDSLWIGVYPSQDLFKFHAEPTTATIELNMPTNDMAEIGRKFICDCAKKGISISNKFKVKINVTEEEIADEATAA